VVHTTREGTVHVYALYDAVKPPQDGADNASTSLSGTSTGTTAAVEVGHQHIHSIQPNEALNQPSCCCAADELVDLQAPSSVGNNSAHSNVVFNNNNVEVVEEHVTAAGADGVQG
jgi:hypothetical protein